MTLREQSRITAKKCHQAAPKNGLLVSHRHVLGVFKSSFLAIY
jgi:hypothetical protein